MTERAARAASASALLAASAAASACDPWTRAWTPTRCAASVRSPLALKLVLLAVAASLAQSTIGGNCTNFTFPPGWPATTLRPPWAAATARGGSSLDAVVLYNSSGYRNNIGGSGGTQLAPANVSCTNPNASIVGFDWCTEGGSTVTYHYCCSYSGLHWVGPWYCSDGSIIPTQYSGNNNGIGVCNGTYRVPSTLCGWPAPSPTAAPTAGACNAFTMPPAWPASAPQPPYQSISVQGTTTLTGILFTNQTNGTVRVGGTAAALLPLSVSCASGALITGFAWQVEGAAAYPFGAGTYSGLHSIGPFQ